MRTDTENKQRTVLIRTPDHRLRVFISSTLNELLAERVAVHEAITRLHLAPVMFESGARPHPAQDVYQAYLAQSHIFIGIYWQSYGWISPDMQISGLEDEYNRSNGLPKLIYIKKPAPNQDPSLKIMLDRIRKENGSSYKYFTTSEELSGLVENDLILLLTEYFETARAEAEPTEGLSATTLTNVPIPRNPLIGRDLEMETASNLLMRPDTGLVTLTGPAGTGKSRLGIQIALQLRDRFIDGVFMVGLESVRDHLLVIPTIAKTLNITEGASGPCYSDLLKSYLSSKQVLLLLDNFEQVLPAAPEIADLLETCPKIKILVTSRASLHLRPEKELPIPPLSLPPRAVAGDLTPLSQYSAVQLFIQRCQAVKPDFRVTNENAPAIAEICNRLDGLPLAIELAAARIKFLPPQLLLSRLDHRFEVLRGGTKDLPERQQTMYNAIDWSYSLLEEAEKLLLQRLSVFTGSWTIEAALAVCDLEDRGQSKILESLEMLADNNLLRWPESESGGPRLRMLESIHEFAADHLNQGGEAGVIQDRYVGYYLTFASQVETELYHSYQTAWHTLVNAELDNLRAVMVWAIAQNQSETVLIITTALWKFWWTHGFWSEGFQWLNAGLATSDSIPVALKAKALTQAGWFYRNMGDFQEAIDVLQQSLALWQQVNDPIGISFTLTNMAASVLRQGDTSRGTAIAEQALKLSRQHGDTSGMSMSLEVLGHVQAKLGNNKKAIERYKEALTQAEKINDEDQIAKLLNNLGDEFATGGNEDQAEEYFNRAAILCKKHGNRIVGGYVSGNRSMIALKKGDYHRASDLLVDAITVMNEIGDKEDTILCLEPIAYIARKLHDPIRAVRLFAASEALRMSIGMTRSQPMQADFDLHIAELSEQLGKSAFDVAWSKGSAWSLEQAVRYAIQHKV